MAMAYRLALHVPLGNIHRILEQLNVVPALRGRIRELSVSQTASAVLQVGIAISTDYRLALHVPLGSMHLFLAQRSANPAKRGLIREQLANHVALTAMQVGLVESPQLPVLAAPVIHTRP